MSLPKTGYLLLEDGTAMQGVAFGYTETVIGELVFNTGMTGYQDILTDPSYAGQVVTLTYPLIGNYGINAEDTQSRSIQASALIVSEFEAPSNWKSTESLSGYLSREKIFGLSDVDTRQLTRLIRSKGTMACLLTTEPLTQAHMDQLRTWQAPTDFVYQVSTKSVEIFPAQGETTHRFGVLDLGIKHGIIRHLQERGVEVHLFPCTTSAEEILSHQFDAILLSNGPGDPKDLSELVNTAKQLMGKTVLFGICLGHQVIAQAYGAKTYKLPFGHRGSNHPVISTATNQVLITAQNHGYSVQTESLPANVAISYRHLHDQTIAGFSDDQLRVYTVQFHPEAGPGPCEGTNIFAEWLNVLKKDCSKGALAYA